jgi:hypothetical protein
MRSPADERTLRRLVTRLAAAAPDDVGLILDALDPAQRDTVEGLLAAYGQPAFETAAPRAADPPAPPPPPDLSHLQGLSPWLAERVAAAAPGAPRGEGRAFRMTPAALAALAASAHALPPESPEPLEMPPPRPRRGGLFGLGRRG